MCAKATSQKYLKVFDKMSAKANRRYFAIFGKKLRVIAVSQGRSLSPKVGERIATLSRESYQLIHRKWEKEEDVYFHELEVIEVLDIVDPY